jgi:arginine-tRNA-protein transferase
MQGTNDRPDNVDIRFRPAFYGKVSAGPLEPSQLDELLGAGYFRNGHELGTNCIRLLNGKWTSIVMLRIPVQGLQWKKRLAKLLRRNAGTFTSEFSPFSPTVEMEALWQRFKREVHGWQQAMPLAEHILRGRPAEDFNTWQLCLFSGGELASFSCFDLGERSMAALEAAYDPKLKRHSLGLYSMLLELEHCQRLGVSQYYPGFYPKGWSLFDYKLRTGNAEYFRPGEGRWVSIGQMTDVDWKTDVLVQVYERLITAMFNAGLVFFEAYNQSFHLPSANPCLNDSPAWMVVKLEARHIAVTWDLARHHYHVYEVLFELPSILPEPDFTPKIIYQFQQMADYGGFDTAEAVVKFLREAGRGSASIVSIA